MITNFTLMTRHEILCLGKFDDMNFLADYGSLRFSAAGNYTLSFVQDTELSFDCEHLTDRKDTYCYTRWCSTQQEMWSFISQCARNFTLSR